MNSINQIKETDLSTTSNYLGSGKFGRVFASKYQGNDVVYKIMKHGISIQMFINELTILHSLQGNSGIVKLYGYTISSTKMIIVMDQAKGITLTDLISYYDVSYSNMLLICRQIASTMVFIHSKNILYCDMKPDNIMIYPETCNVKLIDFGFSIQMDPSNTVIVKGDPCGTTGYIAPEVMFHGRFGKACDVYSFGVLLYVLYTSNPPDRVSRMKTTMKIKYKHNIYKLFCQCTQLFPKNRPSFLEIYNTISKMEKRIENHRKIYTYIQKYLCCFP
jgi:serine/threonine protein kinase